MLLKHLLKFIKSRFLPFCLLEYLSFNDRLHDNLENSTLFKVFAVFSLHLGTK